MKSRHLKKNFRISFIIQTSANDTFLMSFKEATQQFSLRTRNGKIELHLQDKQTLSSDVIVSDKYYHIIELIKDGKSLTLKVDGNVQETINCNEEMRNAKIFIGGYPELKNIPNFSGEIKDIFINNE